MRKVNLCFCLLFILFSSQVKAVDHDGTFQVFGAHNYCWYWLRNDNDTKSNDIDRVTKVVWISGYISAINFHTGRENFKDLSIITVNDYITNFCKEHPQGKTSSAIIEMMRKIKEG
ncbi:hypothetical protein RM153_23985 (plasmid) [Pantoea agglomerans]|uniref:hypothetical protein n=1 Tax=Enterobacter agglomerans TaxID=549 RepID=UPI0028A21894|nr:hypothetical protein [Pantoea agglomerans]WNK51690.1 hypothetical protein RM153_23985 [Pantoea agglomerans]